MATIWKHPNSSRWTAIFKDENGVWRKRSTRITNRTKALALSVEWERAGEMARDRVLTESTSREILDGLLARTTGEHLRVDTLRQFSKRWLDGKEARKAEGTHTRYAGTVERLLEFMGRKADLPISAATPADCEKFYDYLAGLKLAPATLVVEMKTVRTLFNAAHRQGLINTNPAAGVELPEGAKQVRRKTFTPAQVSMLLKEASREWQTCVLLGFFAGLRLSDAVTLTWEQVDLVGRKLVFDAGKTGARMEVPLHPTLDKHLSKLAGDQGGPVCPELSAVPVGGRSGLSKQFLAVMRRAGISNDSVQTGGHRRLSQLSFHALRASFNSGLHNRGVTQELRRKLTGHKSDAVNDRYTQTEFKTLRAAVRKLPALKP